MLANLFDVLIPVYVVLMAGYVALAYAMSTRIGFFSRLMDEKLQDPRFESHLEGLRGILALNVFFHHAAYTWPWLTTGTLSTPASHFMDMLGGASVALFFFLSGYLFWSSFLRQDPRHFSAARFYRLRFFRIAPLYWFYCAVVFVVVLAQTGFVLKVPLGDLIVQCVQWLLVGVPLGHFPDINTLALTRMINVDSTWSLRHEVLFYLLLPFLLPFARGRRTWLLIAVFAGAFVAVYLLNKLAMRHVASVGEATQLMGTVLKVLQDGMLEFCKFLLIGFAPGMFCAYLKQLKGAPAVFARLSGWPAAVLVGLSLLALILNNQPGLQFLRIVPLWVIFVAITCTGTGASFLRNRGVVLLGTISFSVFLLHGVFLYALVPAGLGLYPMFAEANPVTFWLWMGVTGFVVVAVSACTYRFVEHPGMERGREMDAATRG